METTRKEWIETFGILARIEECQVSFCENPAGEALPDYHALRACIPFRDSEIRIMQTAQQIGNRVFPGSLSCTLHDPRLHFKLYLIVRTWFDTLMSQSFCTGNARFDETFIVKSNNPPVAKALFRDPHVQELFLSRTKTINCSACPTGTYITFKNTEARTYRPDEILELLGDFRYLLRYIYAPQEYLAEV